jgi:hypothetical protein
VGYGSPRESGLEVGQIAMRAISFEEKSKLGTLLFLASEATFFIFLIVAYGYFNYSLKEEPTAATSLHPGRSGIYTIALLASSGTLWAGLRSLRRKNLKRFEQWLGATIVLGAVFLFGQSRDGTLGSERHHQPKCVRYQFFHTYRFSRSACFDRAASCSSSCCGWRSRPESVGQSSWPPWKASPTTGILWMRCGL